MDSTEKIFGIGLPKSGTSSLHTALEILGYSSIHNPGDKRTVEEIRQGNYRLSVLERYDAVMDNPMPSIFPQLDAAWPGSKFILTTRPEDAWIESQKRAGFNQSYATPKRGSTVEFHNILLYGCNSFCEDRFRWVYRCHHAQVMNYFSGARRGRLLVLDLGENHGWTELCEFLGKPVPNLDFPHANTVSERIALSPWQKRIIAGLVHLGIDYQLLRRWGRNLVGRKRA